MTLVCPYIQQVPREQCTAHKTERYYLEVQHTTPDTHRLPDTYMPFSMHDHIQGRLSSLARRSTYVLKFFKCPELRQARP